MRFLLLDADAIIDLHQWGIWGSLIKSAINKKCQICAGSIVISESLFYRDSLGQKTPIPMHGYLANGHIQEVSASPLEISQTFKILPKCYPHQIHPGEEEAMAIVNREASGGMHFCSGDKAAIFTMAVLNLSANGKSLEKSLNYFGFKWKYDPKYSESRHSHHSRLGSIYRVQNVKVA